MYWAESPIGVVLISVAGLEIHSSVSHLLLWKPGSRANQGNAISGILGSISIFASKGSHAWQCSKVEVQFCPSCTQEMLWRSWMWSLKAVSFSWGACTLSFSICSCLWAIVGILDRCLLRRPLYTCCYNYWCHTILYLRCYHPYFWHDHITTIFLVILPHYVSVGKSENKNTPQKALPSQSSPSDSNQPGFERV